MKEASDPSFTPEGWHTVTPRIVVQDAEQLMPYGDRRGMVNDEWGNTWQIATHIGDRDAA